MDSYFNLLLNIIQSDSDDSTRQVSLEVNTPEEIDGMIYIFSKMYLILVFLYSIN